MTQTLLSRKDLAERWGVDVTTVDKYEREGIISRVIDIGQPKYSLAAVEIIEAGGVGNALGKVMKENADLRKALEEAEKKIEIVRRMVT